MKVKCMSYRKFDEDGFIDVSLDAEMLSYIICKLESLVWGAVRMSEFENATEYLKMRNEMVEKMKEAGFEVKTDEPAEETE